MKNTLGRLWKFANTPVGEIFSLDTVNSGVESGQGRKGKQGSEKPILSLTKLSHLSIFPLFPILSQPKY